MKETLSLWTAAIVFALAGQGWARQAERRISVEDYRDKMAASWIGQMAGVGWGGPTEFRYKGAIIPEEEVPQWKPEMINQFRQDDIYVEMTFLRSMELHGFDVSIRQADIDFANGRFTEAEMKQINPPPDWTVRDCGNAMKPGLRDEWDGRKNILVMHYLNEKAPCILSRSVKIAIETNVENASRPSPRAPEGGPLAEPKTVLSKRDVLLDKIRGGWVGKSYGVSFGGPTEFKYEGKIIEGSLELNPKGLKRLPGQDDMYVNMALLKAMVDNGIEATSADFAKEFAYGEFLLWHANGQGRQNILLGIPPERSGHPLYNPHAEDIDFQIECDFIGLVCPGLPQAALDICDRAGHIMNYGDGVYGGYFVTAMYAAAFIHDDAQTIVQAGFQALPKGSRYAKIIGDVIEWHKQYPNDWKTTWQKIEDKYNNDLCPWGVHTKFNIQASVNGAYIAIGLLYGQGDLERTVELSTRCGQDSDCNPANAGGIIGTMLGLKNFPEEITAALTPHMNTDFNFTPFSIESASKECLRLALDNITANGGKVSGDDIQIKVQSFETDRNAEIAFPTLSPVDRFYVTDDRLKWTGSWKQKGHRKTTQILRSSSQTGDSLEVDFTGNAVYVQGAPLFDQGILESFIDGKSMGTRDMYMPKVWTNGSQMTAVWITGLPDGKHTLKVVVTGKKNEESEGIGITLGKVVTYSGEIAK